MRRRALRRRGLCASSGGKAHSGILQTARRLLDRLHPQLQEGQALFFSAPTLSELWSGLGVLFFCALLEALAAWRNWAEAATEAAHRSRRSAWSSVATPSVPERLGVLVLLVTVRSTKHPGLGSVCSHTVP